MTRQILVATLLATAMMSGVSRAAVIAADWTDTSGGIIDGIGFTALGFNGPFLDIRTRTYLGGDFSAAPLGATEAIEYGADDDWSLTFDTPLSDLFVYVDLWRGTFTSDMDATTSYTFNLPFTVASGLGGASIAGTTLSLPDDGGFYSGILRFAGPISSLSVDSEGALNASGQILTFATTPSSEAPGPGTWTLLAVGLVTLGSTARRRSRS